MILYSVARSVRAITRASGFKLTDGAAWLHAHHNADHLLALITIIIIQPVNACMFRDYSNWPSLDLCTFTRIYATSFTRLYI